ncbi:MAG TPA: inositol monophosphatase family protein [Verrucomicrobiae bacterium]|jgi:myo-inositol-1(or 4)-monophosphatase|nr:inositol monophosphatase family protein [Verrucomicrobiae bacterium]
MNDVSPEKALASAVDAAKAAGAIMRKNLTAKKKANEITSHDIKLELDVRCQKLIERKLHTAFPQISLLGEEGEAGEPNAEYRWVVDPIDGTVNFAHGIPHASVSIALQQRVEGRHEGGARRKLITHHSSHVTLLGVVYDPFQDELWTAIRGQAARMNGRVIRVSNHRKLKQCIVSIGFAKNRSNLERALPYFTWIARRVQKIRMLGSAALALTYVANGRLDAYIERGISLWDIAAGGLILECAGGKFWHEATHGPHKFRMIASNGWVHKKLPLPK